jgi:cysteine-rich repeat protein
MPSLRSDRCRPIRIHAALVAAAVCFHGGIATPPAWSNPPAHARVDASLARMLEGQLPATGIAIGVTLREKDLPEGRASRMAAVDARQQNVLAALPGGGFQPTRRYRSVAGFAGTANADAIEALARNPFVETVYLDGVVHAALVQGVSLIGADLVHAQGVTGVGVKVAVLDTGVDTNHPDISDDLVAQQCFCDTHPSPQLGGCCPGGAGQGSNAEDDEGHGTAVSGIITSGGVDAGLGVAPDAQIVAVKVLSSTGSGSFSDIAAALDWVLTEAGDTGSPAFGTRVVNMSLSDGGEYNNTAVSPCTGTNTANAINALHAAGIAVFAASGNDAHTGGISFPACVANAISVGGVYDASLGGVGWGGTANCTDSPTAANMFVCHANSGSLLDLLAPNYRTTTSKIGGGTVHFGGTSASSPYAAGQAALLLDANATLTPEDIRTHMTANGTSVTNPANGLSFPRTDIDLAVAAAIGSLCGNGSTEAGEDCDDGNTESGDCCSSNCGFEVSGSACDDADACTDGDTCDGFGTCMSGGALVCDDGLYCNGLESCDSGSGCIAGTAPPTDDGVACTDDSCDELDDAVVNSPNAAACDDADECTADACDAVAGCTHEPIPLCGSPVAATSDGWLAVLAAVLFAGGIAAVARRSGGRRA